jgi:hypothetical protein
MQLKTILFTGLLGVSCLTLQTGCVAPALLAGAQSQLLWSVLKPMVGFDPNEVKLFEQPLVQDRLKPLLGSHFDSTIALLKTAETIQQEGPLFYVASRYTPLPDIAEKAGFVYNADTNQMAVMLVKGGVTNVFAEPLQQQAGAAAQQALGVQWPGELATFTDPSKMKQNLMQSAEQKLQGALPAVPAVPALPAVPSLPTPALPTTALPKPALPALAPLQQLTEATQAAKNSATATVTSAKAAAAQASKNAVQATVNSATQGVTNTVTSAVEQGKAAVANRVSAVSNGVSASDTAQKAQQTAAQALQHAKQATTAAEQAKATAEQAKSALQQQTQGLDSLKKDSTDNGGGGR